jgi:hypothetical protein
MNLFESRFKVRILYVTSLNGPQLHVQFTYDTARTSSKRHRRQVITISLITSEHGLVSRVFQFHCRQSEHIGNHLDKAMQIAIVLQASPKNQNLLLLEYTGRIENGCCRWPIGTTGGSYYWDSRASYRRHRRRPTYII